MRSDIPAKITFGVTSRRWGRIGARVLSIASCVALLVTPAAAASPQDQSAGPVAVTPNPQVFATMCALVAAGFDGNSTPATAELAQLQTHLRGLHGPATEALRDYYRQHALADSGATLSRFLTFALTAGPAPRFEIVLKREALPPDVLALDHFSEVLANFYQEAQIESLWHEFEPAYEQAATSLREPMAQIVVASTAYLREILKPGVRTFRLYVEPMVGSETNVRNIGDEYAVVVNPASPSFDLVRHAFLHFLLDPLVIRYRDKLLGEQPLLFIADRAPNLPYEYHADLTSFFTECFIRAVEFRVRRLPAAQLASEVNAAEANGYVLIPPMMKALAKFEASEPSMDFFFPDLLASIDVISEQERLRTVKFAPAADAESAREKAEDAKKGNSGSELETELSAAERRIAERDAAGAAQAFERILLKVPGQPRAIYGLAVASVLQGDAEHARTLFQQVIAAARADSPEMRPEAATLAWSHIYLGRMHDMEEDREQALEEYRAALAISSASETARSAAQQGIQQAYRPVTRPPQE